VPDLHSGMHEDLVADARGPYAERDVLTQRLASHLDLIEPRERVAIHTVRVQHVNQHTAVNEQERCTRSTHLDDLVLRIVGDVVRSQVAVFILRDVVQRGEDVEPFVRSATTEAQATDDRPSFLVRSSCKPIEILVLPRHVSIDHEQPLVTRVQEGIDKLSAGLHDSWARLQRQPPLNPSSWIGHHGINDR
jgi:hypothetical protein